MKKLFLWLFFCLNVFASSPLLLSQAKDGMLLLPYQEYTLISETITHPFGLEHLHWQSSPTGVFGRNKDKALSRLSITNDTLESQTWVIMHTRPGIDYLDMWVLHEDHTLMAHHVGGDQRPLGVRTFHSINSAMSLTLEPQERITLLMQVDTLGVLDINLQLYSRAEFLKYTKYQTLWWGIFMGILIIFILSNLTHFIQTKRSPYLIHTLYTLTTLFAYTNLYGVLHYLELFPPRLTETLGYITVALSMALHVIYPIALFSLSKTAKRVSTLLYFIALFFLAFGVLFVGAYWESELLLYAKYLTLPIALSMFVVFGVAIMMVIKHKEGAHYYLFSQSCNILAIFYTLCAVSTNWLSLNTEAAKVIGFSVMLEIILITIAMHQRIKWIEHENERHQNIAKLFERYIYMGNYTADIVHQWKRPLNRLGSLTALLVGYFKQGIELSKEKREAYLNELEKCVQDLIDISNDVYGYLSHKNTHEPLNLDELLKRVVEYLGHDGKAVIFSYENTEQTIVSNRAALSQIILVLLSNSLNAIQKRHIPSPKISFRYTHTSLFIEDNTGGIEASLLPHLFTPFNTHSKHGLGTGLYTAHTLAKEKLNATLKVIETTKEGTRFEINFH